MTLQSNTMTKRKGWWVRKQNTSKLIKADYVYYHEGKWVTDSEIARIGTKKKAETIQNEVGGELYGE